MIAALQHGLLGSEFALYAAIALSGAGLAIGLFGAGPYAWLIGWAGRLALAAAIFLAGYQMADDRAAHEAAMAALRGENERLARDLGVQRLIADMADAELTALAEARTELQQRIVEYESELATRPPQAACALSPADLARLRGLHDNAKR